MQATWGEHEPSYFVATHQEKKELLCVIRGTAQMEDLVTDLVAHPVVSPDTAPPPSLQFSCSWSLTAHPVVSPDNPPPLLQFSCSGLLTAHPVVSPDTPAPRGPCNFLALGH